MSIKNIKNQWLLVIVVTAVFIVISALVFFKGKAKPQAESEAQVKASDAQPVQGEGEDEIDLSSKQISEYGIQFAQVARGTVQALVEYPAKLVTNIDQQAHVTSTFAGRVESVNAVLGQSVKQGQVLATLFIPELVDQQANLSIAQESLTLAQQDYQREKQLLDQGVSARQDYQKAYNAYRQAQIQVTAAKSRLAALGASSRGTQGRYALTAPLTGVVSQKDISIGEVVSSSKQLFVIDRLDQLWLEFILPSNFSANVQPMQEIEFKSLQTQNTFKAQTQTLNTAADTQTGRLQVRAKVLTSAQELRPNLMVNVMLQAKDSQPVLRVNKNAIQQIEGKTTVFVVKNGKDKMHFVPTAVELGSYSSDGQWVEIKSGLTEKEQYVTQGSFILKSEMEKGEAEHGH